MTLEFNKVVGKKENGIGEGDKKINTDPTNQEEIDDQEKALNEINNFNEDLPDTSGDNSEDDDSEDEESEEEESEEEESDDEESDEDEESEDDEESDEEESDVEADEEGAEAEEADEPKWKKNGFESADAYIEHLEANGNQKPEVKESEENLTEAEIAESQKNTFVSFLDKHSDILPKSVKENYLKYYESNNNAFLHLDSELHKINEALSMVNGNIPFSKRLEAAFLIAFPNKIEKLAEKRGSVKAEFKAQKVGKSVNSGNGGGGEKGKGSKYSTIQTEMAKRMGVKLK